MGLTAWPTIVDDDGSLIVGTVINEAVFTAVKDSIEDSIFSLVNPAVTGADIVDEVVDARGSKATLDARLDVALNEDGTLKTAASLVTSTQASASFLEGNLVRNGMFNSFYGDVDTTLADWTLTGTGAAMTRAGAGAADTTVVNNGRWCLKCTYGSAELKVTQTLLYSLDLTNHSTLKGKTIQFGGNCKASVASQASIVMDDGVGTTRAGESGNGTYHSGSNAVALLYGSHTIDASATKLDIYLSVASAGTAYFGGILASVGGLSLSKTTPSMDQRFIQGIRVLYCGYNASGTNKSFTIPSGTLRKVGDMLVCEFSGVQVAAGFHGAYCSVGANNYGEQFTNSTGGGSHMWGHTLITRVTATTVNVMHTYTASTGLQGANGGIGVTVGNLDSSTFEYLMNPGDRLLNYLITVVDAL